MSDARAATGARAVPPVGGEVLRDENDLAQRRRAVRRDEECVDLGEHFCHGTGPLLAAEGRDGTEATDAVTALRHLHVGPGGAGGGAGQLQKVESVASGVRRRLRRGPRRAEGDGHRVGRHARAGSGHVDELASEPGHEVNLGEGVAELIAVALRHAAGHDQPCPGGPLLGDAQHGVDRLLAGRLNEGARVDDHQVGQTEIGRAVVPLRLEVTLELVGVHLVLRAPQGLEPVPTHDPSHTLLAPGRFPPG